jgi:hypothetical protein
MKLKTLGISLFMLCNVLTVFSQEVKCTELMQFVKKYGKKKGEVSTLQLINSSWLNEVKCYEIDGVLAVIAKIKTNDYELYGKDYIFCGIPSSNWSAFYSGLYALNSSYGERFHKYIFDYKCDCN